MMFSFCFIVWETRLVEDGVMKNFPGYVELLISLITPGVPLAKLETTKL